MAGFYYNYDVKIYALEVNNLEIIDKGPDPKNPSESILEVNMTDQELQQIEVLAAKAGCSVETLVTQILHEAVNKPKDFIEECAFQSFMDNERKRYGG